MKTEAQMVAETNGWTMAYACGYLDGQTAKRHNRQNHGDLLSAPDEYAEGYRRGLAA